jgi:hypothetical protein
MLAQIVYNVTILITLVHIKEAYPFKHNLLQDYIRVTLVHNSTRTIIITYISSRMLFLVFLPSPTHIVE